MAELEAAARELDAGSTKLAQMTKEFEGAVDADGEFVPGPGTRYEVAVESKLIEIYDEAIQNDRRPPAEDVRKAMANRAVRTEQPDLYSDWQRLSTEIKALQVWISARKTSISARQSVLKGERG